MASSAIVSRNNYDISMLTPYEKVKRADELKRKIFEEQYKECIQMYMMRRRVGDNDLYSELLQLGMCETEEDLRNMVKNEKETRKKIARNKEAVQRLEAQRLKNDFGYFMIFAPCDEELQMIRYMELISVAEKWMMHQHEFSEENKVLMRRYTIPLNWGVPEWGDSMKSLEDSVKQIYYETNVKNRQDKTITKADRDEIKSRLNQAIDDHVKTHIKINRPSFPNRLKKMFEDVIFMMQLVFFDGYLEFHLRTDLNPFQRFANPEYFTYFIRGFPKGYRILPGFTSIEKDFKNLMAGRSKYTTDCGMDIYEKLLSIAIKSRHFPMITGLYNPNKHRNVMKPKEDNHRDLNFVGCDVKKTKREQSQQNTNPNRKRTRLIEEL